MVPIWVDLIEEYVAVPHAPTRKERQTQGYRSPYSVGGVFATWSICWSETDLCREHVGGGVYLVVLADQGRLF